MGLFSLFARFLSARHGIGQSRLLAAEPFAPRRLENRRLLDASAAGLLLAPPSDAGEFVQAGQLDNPSAGPDPSVTTPLAGTDEGESSPSNLEIAPLMPIDENGFAQLELTFENPDELALHTIEIDWGDGSTSTVQLNGGERYLGTSHQYLDDTPTGPAEVPYTITVKVTDDDGGMTSGATSVLVKNVAPVIETLSVTPTMIDEANIVTVSGTYSDIGSLDTHTATIRWGDGTVEAIPLVASGSSGSFTISHFYADNDTVNPDDVAVDNFYTIVVTVIDDDGGMHARSIDVTVLNVSPNLEPIIEATDVNIKGETFLTIQFDDPGADTLYVYVDWGDIRDPGNPALPGPMPYVIDPTTYDGPGTFTVTLKHKYSGPPNPLSPSSDIVINVFVGDDDFGKPGVQADGMSQIRTVAISNPGDGTDPVHIDTTPQVPRLLFPRDSQEGVFLEASTTVEESLRRTDLRAASGDPSITTDRFLELRVIDAAGQLGEGYRLKTEVLDDLPGLFRELPDNHYAIFLVRLETNTRRLVIEVYVRNGKVIDPGDDSEGTRDRPPTDEATQQPAEVQKLELRPPAAEQEAGPAEELPDDTSGRLDLPTSESPAISDSGPTQLDWAPTAAGLVATTSFQSWAARVDRALLQAGPRHWKQLRLRYPPRRKNR
ncbi:MAG: hypothetical protein KDA57_02480 [Planctomycetales bacterium]|nr:hypothetical protein [Planctomycetales bacterium]